MFSVIVALLSVLSIAICLAICFYRWLLLAAHLRWRRRQLRTERASGTGISRAFLTIVPANNEEVVLRDCLIAIRQAHQTTPRCRTLVIADNCRDQTAAVAAANGADVLVRKCSDRRGKGAAIVWALERIDLSSFDAIAFIDADTLVHPDFYRTMNRYLDAGHRVLQGYDGVANPGQSPLTRLIAVTNVMKNLLFNHGKSLLGLSPLLMGTGMVLTREVLEAHPWSAQSIVENLEESLNLIEAGERIVFIPEARVYAQEAATLRAAYHQRQRWASGQAALFRRALRIAARGVRERKFVLVDAGLELLLPVRYSRLMNLSLTNLLFVFCLTEASPLLVSAGALPIALQMVEFGIGVAIVRPKHLLSGLALAGPFLVWKAAIEFLALAGFRSGVWRPTRGAFEKSNATSRCGPRGSIRNILL